MNQAFLYTVEKNIRIIWDACLTFNGAARLAMMDCALRTGATWEYDSKLRLVHHGGKCMTMRDDTVVGEVCSDSPAQQWTFSEYVNS